MLNNVSEENSLQGQLCSNIKSIDKLVDKRVELIKSLRYLNDEEKTKEIYTSLEILNKEIYKQVEDISFEISVLHNKLYTISCFLFDSGKVDSYYIKTPVIPENYNLIFEHRDYFSEEQLKIL